MMSFIEELKNGNEQAILTVASAYFLMAALVSLVYQLRILSWPTVRGTLDHSALDKFGVSGRRDEQSYEAGVVYHYYVNGKQFVGTRLSPFFLLASSNLRFLLRWQMNGITKLDSDEVSVFFNPSNPQKSFLIIPGKIGLSLTTIVIVVSLLVIINSI